jgi:hypothetical protein
LAPARFGLFPFRSPLLRESRLLSFPQGTEMFQFPWFPLPALCVQAGVTPHDGCRVSPFGHPRINARSTASRGFSQSPTSFIGSRRQGIHRWLFVAWKNKFFLYVNKDARARSAILKGQKKPHRSSGGLKACDAVGGSLKTEERTRSPSSSRRTGELNLHRSTSTRTDRQCTNWECLSVIRPDGRRRGGTP